VELFESVTTETALDFKTDATVCTDSDGSSPSKRAAAPATWGHAIDVPDRTVVCEFELCPADLMLTPGAKISTQLP
jgi:hypothetical protein